MKAGAISDHRNICYGIAAVMIILTHSARYVPEHFIMYKLLLYMNLGVPIFAFLSGMGIYYSLKIKRNTTKQFYANRLNRVLVPYLCIMGLGFGVLHLVASFNPMLFLYRLSALKFWVEGDNLWYIAMLIPVYLLAPIYSNWVEKGQRGLKTAVTSGIFVVALLVLAYYLPDLYARYHIVLRTAIVLLLGYYWGECISRNERIKITWPIIFALLYLGQAIFRRVVGENIILDTAVNSFSFALLGVPLILFLTFVIDFVTKRMSGVKTAVLRLCSSIGKVSLESYLFNFLCGLLFRALLKEWNISQLAFPWIWMCYVVGVGGIGVLLSFLMNWFLQKIRTKNVR